MRELFAVVVLGSVSAPILSAQVGTIAAFREHTRGVGERVFFAAEAMPAELYSFQATREQSTFASLLGRIGYQTYNLCQALTGARPQPGNTDASKSGLLTLVRSSFAWCDEVLQLLDDARLSDTVVVDLREAFPFAPRPRTRASAMTLTAAYWADIYAQLAQYLRLNGRIPPVPCGRDSDDTTSCDSGLLVCQPTLPRGAPVSRMVLSDAPYSVRSDGRGAYVRGQDGAVVAAGNALVLYWPVWPRGVPNPRSVSIDLSQPVAGGGGTSHGLVQAPAFEVMSQWYKEQNQAQHSVLEIPIGSEVQAEQANVVFNMNGVRHALQMGPQPLGHCFSDGSAMTGLGTSRATIRRIGETHWIVELPPGSIGRLFDVHLGEPNAIDRGLFYVSFRYEIRQ